MAAVVALAACGGAEGGVDGSENNGTEHHDNNGATNTGSGTNGYAANNGSTANNGYDDSYENNGTYGGGTNNYHSPEPDRENYEAWAENEFVLTADEPTSTFGIDVDTASYTLARRKLTEGTLPNPDGVRVEEFINYFDYQYPQPTDDTPFSINMEIAPSAFGEELHLLRIGLRGRDVAIEDMKPTNLVFLVDVSGSMQSGDRLPLVKHTLKTLVDRLRPTDTIGLVTYANGTKEVLQPTPVSERQTILDAIDALEASGGTHGGEAIVKAYEMASAGRIEGGNNRVLLATDGDFNIGLTGQDLRDLVESHRDLHIALTVLGYGVGNLNDADLEAFARNANGNYFYIDSEAEAERKFGSDLPSTLEVIAADVKVQVEFASDTIVRYRLIGYENRMLDNQDFDDDAKDAGEIGPGHTVTALYELEIDETATSETGLLAEVRVRHKEQFGETSHLYSSGIKLSQVQESFESATTDFRFAAAVAEFAEILRESMHSEGARFDDLHAIGTSASRSDDPDQAEFLDLVNLAKDLWPAP